MDPHTKRSSFAAGVIPLSGIETPSQPTRDVKSYMPQSTQGGLSLHLVSGLASACPRKCPEKPLKVSVRMCLDGMSNRNRHSHRHRAIAPDGLLSATLPPLSFTAIDQRYGRKRRSKAVAC